MTSGGFQPYEDACNGGILCPYSPERMLVGMKINLCFIWEICP